MRATPRVAEFSRPDVPVSELLDYLGPLEIYPDKLSVPYAWWNVVSSADGYISFHDHNACGPRYCTMRE